MSANSEEDTGEQQQQIAAVEITNGVEEKEQDVAITNSVPASQREATEVAKNVTADEVQSTTEVDVIASETPVPGDKNDAVVENTEADAKASVEDTKSEVQEPEKDVNAEALSSEIAEVATEEVPPTDVKMIEEKVVELPLKDEDKVASKENIDKNVLDDDLIFVKPKDKDRSHCYWYSTFSFMYFLLCYWPCIVDDWFYCCLL